MGRKRTASTIPAAEPVVHRRRRVGSRWQGAFGGLFGENRPSRAGGNHFDPSLRTRRGFGDELAGLSGRGPGVARSGPSECVLSAKILPAGAASGWREPPRAWPATAESSAVVEPCEQRQDRRLRSCARERKCPLCRPPSNSNSHRPCDGSGDSAPSFSLGSPALAQRSSPQEVRASVRAWSSDPCRSSSSALVSIAFERCSEREEKSSSTKTGSGGLSGESHRRPSLGRTSNQFALTTSCSG